jgi:hypothetical protein
MLTPEAIVDFPNQQSADPAGDLLLPLHGRYDPRNHLNPRRLTIAMWDQAYLLRHQPGESFADWDRVLDEAVERGYNTLRIDPLVESLDLDHPERELTWGPLDWPFLPWNWTRGITCPAGRWLIEFLQKVADRKLWVTFSSWWSHDESAPPGTAVPSDTVAGAALWSRLLRGLQREVGLDRIVYVDFANEMPYFFPGFGTALKERAAPDQPGNVYSEGQKVWLRDQLDRPLAVLQAEFPSLRFTHSIHGDPRWFQVGLTHLDCLDVHFYADADPRWTARTGFAELARDGRMFRDDSSFRDFGERSAATYRAVGPMLHARQRGLMRQFAAWSANGGMPLTCSEGWASWFYIDHPDLDWGWLLEWSERAVADAIEFGFWGVTPNNYIQPQFRLWQDVRFHRRLNEMFIAS